MEVVILEREFIHVVMKHVRIHGFNLRNELVAKHSFVHMTVLSDIDSSKLDHSVIEKLKKNNNKTVKVKITGLAVYTHGPQEIYLAVEVEAEGLANFRRIQKLPPIDQHVTIGHMWFKKYQWKFVPRVSEWVKQEQDRLVQLEQDRLANQMDRLVIKSEKYETRVTN